VGVSDPSRLPLCLASLPLAHPLTRIGGP
jgi:hypothetical protein